MAPTIQDERIVHLTLDEAKAIRDIVHTHKSQHAVTLGGELSTRIIRAMAGDAVKLPDSPDEEPTA